MDRLSGKSILITAGSKNVGRRMAERLLAANARVAISSREDPAVYASWLGNDGRAFQCEATDIGQLDRLLAGVEDYLGAVDILVNNLGPSLWTGNLLKADLEDWEYTFNAGPRTAWYLAKHLVPRMKERGWGRVVNVSSTASFALADTGVYGAAKAAVERITRELAILAGPEVTVNALAPGLIMPQTGLGEASSYVARCDAAVLQTLVTQEQLAELLYLMLSPAFDCITGETLVADGGEHLIRR